MCFYNTPTIQIRPKLYTHLRSELINQRDIRGEWRDVDSSFCRTEERQRFIHMMRDSACRIFMFIFILIDVVYSMMTIIATVS